MSNNSLASLLPSRKRKEAGPPPEFTKGERVWYRTDAGNVRTGTVIGDAPVKGVIGVQLDGDPFGVCLKTRKMSKTGPPPQEGGKMATKTKAKAVKPKAEAKPKASGNGNNPYREGSSMAFIFEQLLKGGKAGEIGGRMAKKFPIKVRAEVDDPDAHRQAEAVQRVLDVLKAAEKAGLKVSKEGRGAEAVCKIG